MSQFDVLDVVHQNPELVLAVSGRALNTAQNLNDCGRLLDDVDVP